MQNLSIVKKITRSSSLMYSLRMMIAFLGITFVPYYLDQQILTVPLALGVVAAALSDIDDRFSVHIRNLFFTYLGFFITAVAIELLFPHPVLFGLALIISCFCLILLGSLGKRYATISYGCLVVSVYAMLGVDLFDNWYQQPALLVAGAAWYGLLSTISFLIFPVRLVRDQLARCYASVGQFLFIKSNLFDVDMTPKSYQQSMIELSLENGKVINGFNETRISLVTRLKGDRGRKDTRRSLQYYFIVQDIHERADSAHIDYEKLTKIFEHRDVLFRFQRILTLQGKACQDLAQAINTQQAYKHNPAFPLIFKNLNNSIIQLEKEARYDFIWLNALRGLEKNLKEIDAQLKNLESERLVSNHLNIVEEDALKDDSLTGWQDIGQRIRKNFSPESSLFRHATRLSILLLIAHILVQVGHLEYGYWILLTTLFVCQPNFNATKRRLKLRILGTLAGITLGVLVLTFVPSIEGQLLLIVLSGVLFLQLRSQQYAQATMFITLMALINFHLAAPDHDAAIPRAIYTFIGCFLAWGGIMFIWPDWKFRRLPQIMKKALTSQCDYLSEVVKQYHEGRNNGLDYRVVRRDAHRNDAELASLISTLATEPDFGVEQKQYAFRFLCLSHTFLSYIAALGAHRNKLHDHQTLLLLDEALEEIRATLLNDESLELKAQAAINTLREITEQQQSSYDPHTTVVLQQIALILNILPELCQLKQSLTYDHDPDSTALASI